MSTSVCQSFNVNILAASDSSLIPKNVNTHRIWWCRYTGIKANILLNISEIPCYLVNKLCKKRSTLTVFRDT